jgi:hypothetical protein
MWALWLRGWLHHAQIYLLAAAVGASIGVSAWRVDIAVNGPYAMARRVEAKPRERAQVKPALPPRPDEVARIITAAGPYLRIPHAHRSRRLHRPANR